MTFSNVEARLVASSAAGESSLSSYAEYLEPAFQLSGYRRLLYRGAASHDWILDHLAGRVDRNPRDLRAHVQRILLLAHAEKARETADALMDLHRVLNGHGRGLLNRLLQQCQPLLGTLYQQLQTHFQNTPKKTTQLVRLLLDQPTAPESVNDPLSEAMECLDWGQTETAMQILEKAVLATPQRSDLNRTLLDLYRRSGARDRLDDMLAQLGGRRTALPDLWEETLDYLAQEDEA